MESRALHKIFFPLPHLGPPVQWGSSLTLDADWRSPARGQIQSCDWLARLNLETRDRLVSIQRRGGPKWRRTCNTRRHLGFWDWGFGSVLSPYEGQIKGQIVLFYFAQFFNGILNAVFFLFNLPRWFSDKEMMNGKWSASFLLSLYASFFIRHRNEVRKQKRQKFLYQFQMRGLGKGHNFKTVIYWILILIAKNISANCRAFQVHFCTKKKPYLAILKKIMCYCIPFFTK